MSSTTAALTGATAAASPSRWAAGAWGRVPALRVIQGLATLLHAAFIFFACFAFSDASPYDLVAIPTIVLWLALGIRLHRGRCPSCSCSSSTSRGSGLRCCPTSTSRSR
ncbi:hypothetical protein GCM10025880_47440 [Methylorubrum aminovorans]|nr:hypothetical protein GCM10025880_47440 [Methylorubrum aminovorans]